MATIQHNAITEANLHETKGVSTATTGKFLKASAGVGSWAFQEYTMSLDIDNLDTVADYYLNAPYAGTLSKIYTVIDGAILTADKDITASIGGVAVTNGVVTIAFTGAAAGDTDSATPSAANTVTAGQAIKFAATGATTGAIRGHLICTMLRTA